MSGLSWISSDFSTHLILILAHSLWQATVIAVGVYALARWCATGPKGRYLIYLSGLVLLVVSPVVTLLLLLQNHEGNPRTQASIAPLPQVARTANLPTVNPQLPQKMPEGSDELVQNSQNSLAEETVPSESITPTNLPVEKSAATPISFMVRVRQFSPHLATAYFVGVSIMMLRLTVGLCGARRLSRSSALIQDSAILEILESVCLRIGRLAVPPIAASKRVTVPIVVGIFRPMILLPTCILSGLTPAQLNAVIAHEVAHIHRMDQWVNLFQRLIEAILFFNPAVWWISSRLRFERENCCDDLAAEAVEAGQTQGYAGALVRAAELCQMADAPLGTARSVVSAAMHRMSGLRSRVYRLIHGEQQPQLRLGAWPMALMLLAALVVSSVWLDRRPARAQVATTVPSHDLSPNSDSLLFFSDSSNIIILNRPQEDADHGMPPLLDRELIRQALLMAARDAGYYTRDAVLGESAPADIAAQSVDLTITINPKGTNLDVTMSGPQNAAGHTSVEIPTFPKDPNIVADVPDLSQLATRVEALTHTQFTTWLKTANITGEAKPASHEAQVPPELESRLMELTILGQYAAVRQAHAEIRAHGVSPAMLEVLVRGYANLGQFTQMLWNADSEVFTARSLLYAQRLLVADSGSPRAHWARAYALAMAGLHAAALNEMDPVLAGSAEGARIEALCKYDTNKLLELADSGPAAYKPLTHFMAFLTMEHSNRSRWIDRVGDAVLTSTPQSERVRDAMTAWQNGGQSPEANADMYRAELPRINDLPAKVHTAWESAHVNPNLMADVGSVADAFMIAPGQTEPSWSAMGSLLKDMNFVYAYRAAHFLTFTLSVDPSQSIQQMSPIIAGNQFAPLFAAFDNHFHKQPMPEELKDIPTTDATFRLPFEPRVVDLLTGSTKPAADRFLKVQSAHISATAWDCERKMLQNTVDKRLYDWNGAPEHANWLRVISPYCPVAPAEMLLTGSLLPTPEKFVSDMDERFGKQPAYTEVLAEYYMHRREYDKAVGVLVPIIHGGEAVEGDYKDLANCYRFLNDDANWLATMKAEMNVADPGLDHANFNRDIADHLMSEMKYQLAKEYANAASESGAEWAMMCLAKCDCGLGDFAGADALVKESLSRYQIRSPIEYYEWCAESGHGDINSARQTAIATIQRSPGDRSEAFYYLGEGDAPNAFRVVHDLYEAHHAPFVGLWLIDLADAAGNQAQVDEVLQDMQPGGAVTFGADAAGQAFQACADCIRAMRNPRSAPMVEKPLDILMDQIRYDDDPVQSQVRYFIGAYRIQHGDEDGVKDLIFCSLHHSLDSDVGFLARIELRKRNIDPWNPATQGSEVPAATMPAQ